MNLTAPWNATNGHSNGTHEKIDEVRDVLSREADHLAEVAAQFGRDAADCAKGWRSERRVGYSCLSASIALIRVAR